MRFALTLLVLGIAAGGISIGCTNTDTPAEAPVETSGVEREIRDFSLTETREGRLSWKLHSDFAWRLPGQSQVRLEDVDLRFFDDTGAERSRLTALKGEVSEDSGNMTARGRVNVITADQDTLITEELTYDKDLDRIAGPGFVRLSSPDRVLTGVGFESDPDLTDYRVYEDVQITVVDHERTIDAGS